MRSHKCSDVWTDGQRGGGVLGSNRQTKADENGWEEMTAAHPALNFVRMLFEL